MLNRDKEKFIYIEKMKDIKQVGVGVKYGHSALSISPSVSFPASAGISFSSKVESIGPNQLMCYR